MMKNHNNQIVVILSLLFVVFNCEVNTQEQDNLPAELQPHNQPSLRNRNNPQLSRAKRMYALCPPEFQKIGNDCFYMSKKKYNWLDAHFECKDRNSKLAEPLKFADRRLRKYLLNRDEILGDNEKWIGGTYNHQLKKWQWGYNGGQMKYQAFDDAVEGSNLEYHCTVMDPKSEYKWTARKCTELHYFICQHRMSLVNEKQRSRVYTKWNETYPNQMANEVEVYVSTNGNNNRSNSYRKKSRTGINRLNQVNNELHKSDLTSSTPAPDYLPYNVYSKLETFEQKPQEDIHPVNSATNVQKMDQESLKQRKRHSRPLKLSGDVDLGFKKKRTKKFEKKNQVDVVIPKQSVIDENDNNNDYGRHQHKHHNHHNHHHAKPHPNIALPETEVDVEKNEKEVKSIIELKPVLEFLTTPPEPVEYTKTTPLSVTTTSSTAAPAIIERTTMSELRKKLEEKAQRRERLKEKLAKLTPEERQAFLLMKQQRAEARKKGYKIGS